MQKFNTHFENIKLLNRVRLVAIISQISLIIFATVYLDILLPMHRIFILITFEVLFQLLSWHRLKTARDISPNEVMIHIFFDSLILAGLIYFTGGANNPFIYLLLLPIALGTIMLRLRELVILALVQIGLYSLLNIYQRPFELGDSSPLASFHLHLLGMWANFALTVFLMVVFGFLARQSLVRKEQQIQALHEEQMKDEQVLSLGIMSANAAHQLGTPLSTMAIIIDDLKYESKSSAAKQELQLVEQQIGKCREIIRTLAEKSRLLKGYQANHPVEELFKDNLVDKLEQWLVFRPQIHLLQEWQNGSDKLKFQMPKSVEQALINLLDNAADASVANQDPNVELIVRVENQHLVIKIVDQGTGISDEQIQSAGNRLVDTEKSNGFGWGLFLSNASIQRAGGEVFLTRGESKGTVTQIRLPLPQNDPR